MLIAVLAFLLGGCGLNSANSGANGSAGAQAGGHHTGSTKPNSSTPSAYSRCHSYQLRLVAGMIKQGISYGFQLPFRLTNVSQRGCSLQGFPGVEFFSVTGARLTPNPIRLGSSQDYYNPSKVMLYPMSSAYFLVQVTHATESNSCRVPIEVESYAPGSFAPLNTYLPLNVTNSIWRHQRLCAGVRVSITPVATSEFLQSHSYLPSQSLGVSNFPDVTVSPGRCHERQLALSAGSQTFSLDGKLQFFMSYSNTSSTACVISGYPGIGFLDSSGKVVPATVNRPGGLAYLGSSKPHVLLPGGDVLSVVSVSSGSTTGTACSVPTTVESYPPNDFHSLSFTIQAGLLNHWRSYWQGLECNGLSGAQVAASVSALFTVSQLETGDATIAKELNSQAIF